MLSLSLQRTTAASFRDWVLKLSVFNLKYNNNHIGRELGDAFNLFDELLFPLHLPALEPLLVDGSLVPVTVELQPRLRLVLLLFAGKEEKTENKENERK